MADELTDSSTYVPLELRDRELYVRTTQLIDTVAEDVYLDNLCAALGAFNPKADGFDSEALLSILGGQALVDLLEGSGVPAETIAHILPRLFNLKGTEPGLDMLLRFALGYSPQTIVGWEVWRGHPDNPANADKDYTDSSLTIGPDNVYLEAYRAFADSFPGAEVSKKSDLACKVYFRIGVGGSPSDSTQEDQQVLNVVRRFMPVCSDAIIQVSNQILGFPNRLILNDLLEPPPDRGAHFRDTVPSPSGLVGNRHAPTSMRASDRGPDHAGHVTVISDPPSPMNGETRVAPSLREIISVNPLVYSGGLSYANVGDADAKRYAASAATGLQVREVVRIVQVEDNGVVVNAEDYDLRP